MKLPLQKLQDNSCVFSVLLLLLLLSSGRVDCLGGGGVDGKLLSRLLLKVVGVFEFDCSSSVDELLLSSNIGGGNSSARVIFLVRYGACITGLIFNSKANGLKEETETSRESPNLENDEVQCDGREIKSRKGEDYTGLRPRLSGE